MTGQRSQRRETGHSPRAGKHSRFSPDFLKHKVRIGSVIATGLLAASLLLAGCGSYGATARPPANPAGLSSAAASPEAASPEATTTVASSAPPATPAASPSAAPATAPAASPSAAPATAPAASPSTATTTATAILQDAAPPVARAETPGDLPRDALTESYFGPLPKASHTRPLQRSEIRAIYLGAAASIDAALAIARTTVVNAVVIDLKESDGVKYASNVPLASQIGAVKPAYSLPKVIKRFHEEQVKVIGRIVCFKDPLLAEARPDLTIKDADGAVLRFSLEGGKPFVSPYSKTVWQYNVDLALEAIAMGVDEIQFDYIRFPTGGTESGARPHFGQAGQVPGKIQAINRFLQYARIRIQEEAGVPLGADVFAAAIISRRDGETIGQDWDSIGLTGIDSLSPMVYPSHFANSAKNHYTGNGVGQKINGILFDKPDLRPYEVMYNTLACSRPGAGQPTRRAAVRPYLQAFTAAYLPQGYYMAYGAAAIRQQIEAVRDAGYTEWILWNPRAQYPADAFEPQA